MEIFVGLLIVWLLFGIACAVIATNKGRSGGGWFVLGGSCLDHSVSF